MEQYLNQSNCRGRKMHNFYEDLLYINKRLENGRLAAQCIICSATLKNTAIARLRTHRKRCHPDSSVESICETFSNDIDSTQRIRKNIKNPALSSQESDINEETEEKIIFEIDDNTESASNSLNIDLKNYVLNDTPSVSNQTLTIDSKQDIFKSKEVCLGTSGWHSLAASSSSLSSYTPSSTPDRELYHQRQNTTKRSKKKLKNTDTYKLNCHVDSMTPKLKQETDMALAKFFFGCNIPFAVVESDHFKHFLKILRPSYAPPCRKTLSTVLLDKISENLLTTNKNYLDKESTLLINGWKNSSNDTNNVVTMLQTAGGQSLFLESYDFSILRETGEALANICQKSIDLARSRYDCEVYAVVSDNASNMCKMNRITNLWYTTCYSHIGNLLAKDIIDIETITTVNKILKEFKRANLENIIIENGGSKIVLPIDTRWCSNRDACVSFIKNLPIMKKIVAEGSITVKPEIAYGLYDDDFVDNINETIILLNPVSDLINKCQSVNFSIADAAEAWINLKNNMSEKEYKKSITNAVETRYKMAMNIYSLTANYLHPVYRGKKLDNEQLNSVQDFLIEILDENGLNALNMFNRNEDIFEKLLKKKITLVNTFWGLVEKKFTSLATLAQKLLKIPASSAQLERVFSNWSLVHSRNRLTKEKSANLVFVYYSLKLRDSNFTDQY